MFYAFCLTLLLASTCLAIPVGNEEDCDYVVYENREEYIQLIDVTGPTPKEDGVKALFGSNMAALPMGKNSDGEQTLEVIFKEPQLIQSAYLRFKWNHQVKLDLYDESNNKVYNGDLKNNPWPNNAFAEAIWTPAIAGVKKAVITGGDWTPSDEMKIRDLKFEVCSPPEPEQPCHCQILADPVAHTCSGDVLFLKESDGPQVALISDKPACPFTLWAVPISEGHTLNLKVTSGGDEWTIDPQGNVVGPEPAPFSQVPFAVGVGGTYTFACGYSFTFGEEGAHFVKADILLPGGSAAAGGFCVGGK